MEVSGNALPGECPKENMELARMGICGEHSLSPTSLSCPQIGGFDIKSQFQLFPTGSCWSGSSARGLPRAWPLHREQRKTFKSFINSSLSQP